MMQKIRKWLLTIHLLIACLTIPFVILVVVSGILYLAGVKGELEISHIETPDAITLDFDSKRLEHEVRKILLTVDSTYDFEYLKVGGNTVYTRPTSKAHYRFQTIGDQTLLYKRSPDLQASMIELHKGHGPLMFKRYQQLIALCLLAVLMSGVFMALLNKKHRAKTIGMLFIGSALFISLASQ